MQVYLQLTKKSSKKEGKNFDPIKGKATTDKLMSRDVHVVLFRARQEWTAGYKLMSKKNLKDDETLSEFVFIC